MSENNNNDVENKVTSAERLAQVPQKVGGSNNNNISIYYKPTLVKEDPLPLESSQLSYASKLLRASNNGLIPVKLEEDVIIQRISHDLYSDLKSGFRELYNNEARACRIARKNYPDANPHIVVALNSSERKLVIHGTDSMGMSQQKFLTVYTVLGRSDNFDSTEVGQFGMGRAAYTCLSDVMVLETYSRETGEKYAVMGKNGVGYNVLPQPADLDSYGTRITITLREDISIQALVEYIFDICRFSGVRTTVELEDEISDFNNTFHAGQYELGLESMKEYVASLREKNGDEEKLLLSVEIADNPDFYLYGEIIARKSSWEEDYSRVLDKGSAGTHLVSVPIKGDLGDLPLSRWIVNIKDERKYPPTADRERLTDAAIAVIREKILSALREKLQPALKLDSLSDYIRSPYRMLYTGGTTYYNNGLAESLLPLLDDRTREIVEFVNTKVEVLRMRNGKMCRTQTKISSLIDAGGSETQRLFCVRNLRSAAADALRERAAGEVFESDLGITELMAKFGVIDGDQYVKENNLKRTTYSEPDTITAYYKFGGYNTYTEKIRIDMIAAPAAAEEEEGEKEEHWLMPLIAMTSEQKDEYVQLMDHDTRYRIVVCGKNDTRKKRLLAGKCVFLDDFVASVAKKQVVTSIGGMMTVEETLGYIREKGMDIALLVYDEPQALAESTRKLLFSRHDDDDDDDDNNDGNESGDYDRKSILSVVVPDEDSRYELKVFYRYNGVTETLGWRDVFNDIKQGLLDREEDNLDEQKANVIMHAMAAFGGRYPELFELLAHAMADVAKYYDVEKLRGHAFSLAAVLDDKKGIRAGNDCAMHSEDAIEGTTTEVKCLAEITEWVK